MQLNTAMGADAQAFQPFDCPSTADSAATQQELRNQLGTKLAGLESLLKMTCGGSGQAFRKFSEPVQDEYLTTCAALASECQALLTHLSAPPVRSDRRRGAMPGYTGIERRRRADA